MFNTFLFCFLILPYPNSMINSKSLSYMNEMWEKKDQSKNLVSISGSQNQIHIQTWLFIAPTVPCLGNNITKEYLPPPTPRVVGLNYGKCLTLDRMKFLGAMFCLKTLFIFSVLNVLWNLTFIFSFVLFVLREETLSM